LKTHWRNLLETGFEYQQGVSTLCVVAVGHFVPNVMRSRQYVTKATRNCLPDCISDGGGFGFVSTA